MKALEKETITLYGDGRQVRDILFVEDLADAMSLAMKKIGLTAGHAFNIGGGPENTTSLLELLDMIGAMIGEPVMTKVHDWRTGDQRYYVSDTSKFKKLTGWAPEVDVTSGVRRLAEWLVEESPVLKPKCRLLAQEEIYGRNITVR
jgi:CDP-paratose 2-epimerase